METYVFNFTTFFKAVPENGLYVMALVLVLTKLCGMFGAKGRLQLGLALGIGLLLGVGFMIAALGIPGDFAAWFSVIVFGLAMGGAASLGYETFKGISIKAAIQALGVSEPTDRG